MPAQTDWLPAEAPRTETLIGHPGSVEALDRAKELGVKAISIGIAWGHVEPRQGQWDFSEPEQRAREVVAHGLLWAPQLIFTSSVPEWFIAEGLSVKQRCIEHDHENGPESIFNPNLRPHMRRYFEAFLAHFAPTGLLEQAYEFELFACQYGEPNYFFIDRTGPTVPGWGGALHHGFQCGDELARADFRRAMKDKYGDIKALNKAWGVNVKDFAELEFRVPAEEREDPKDDFTLAFDEQTNTYRYNNYIGERLPLGRRWIDQICWYRESMNDYFAYVVNTAREVLGDRRLCARLPGCCYLSWLGSAPALNVKTAAAAGAEVRFTGAVHPYDQKVLSTACRFYRTPMWTEPMYAIGRQTGPTLMRARRWFDAVFFGASCGQSITRSEYTNSFFDREAGVLEENFPVYRRAAEATALGQPHVRYAVLLPTTQSYFGFDHRYFISKFETLLDYTDADIIDEQLIADGALERYDAVLVRTGGLVEDVTLDRLEQFVRAGGLVAFGPKGFLRRLGDPLAGHALVGGESTKKPEKPGLREVGHGAVLVCGGDEDDVLIPDFLAAAEEVCGHVVPDGAANDVLATRLGEDLLLFNRNDEPVLVEMDDQQVRLEAYDEASMPLARVPVGPPGPTVRALGVASVAGGAQVTVEPSEPGARAYVELRRPDYRTVYVDLATDEQGRLAGLAPTPLPGEYTMTVYLLDAKGRPSCWRRLRSVRA